MKFSASILTLLLSTLVASDGLSFLGSQKALGDGAAVPGDNPLTYCKKDHDDDILVIKKVNLTPNPPVKYVPHYLCVCEVAQGLMERHRGSTLTIEAVGDLLEDVDEGAYVVLQVKYGLIRLVNTEADLCEQVSNVDLTCPIKKGKTTIVKDVQLPKEIPPVSIHLIPSDAVC